jgi:CRISPR-associated protein Cmr3
VSTGSGWRSFQLVPDDLLFFRDGRPSSRGDDHHLRSVFPPHPGTLYGAVRTRRLIDADVDLRSLNQGTWNKLPEALRAELGEWGGFGSLELRGPWLVREGEALVPAPQDLAIRRKPTTSGPQHRSAPTATAAAPEVERVHGLHPWNTSGASSHGLALLGPEPPLEADDDAPELPRDWWLRPAGLAAWQAGGLPAPEHLVHRSLLWTEEPRTGVGLRDDQRTGEDGLIYTFGFIRLHAGVSFGFEVRGGDLSPGHRLRLGGEGRTGWIEEGPALPKAQERRDGATGVRVSLVTPALWESGALPPAQGADGPSLHGASITAAVVPGSLPVGGWDLAKGRPKPMRRAVPAGAVLFLDGHSPERATRLIHEIHGSNLSTYPGEHLAQQGFGLAVAGYAPQEASDG